jgi:hypothetical protein
MHVADGSLPSLARATRFGTTQALTSGWRSWLANWLGSGELAAAAPASVAAAACDELASADMVWLAAPVHLSASLTTVHLDPFGLLRLDAVAQDTLRASFERTFRDSGYRLVPTSSGVFLTAGPALTDIETADPAHHLGSSITEALPKGRDAPALRRLGAEIDMWLHEHPVNQARQRERRRSISSLWFWGGGAPLRGSKIIANAAELPDVYSDDAYVTGLCRAAGRSVQPLRHTFAAIAESHTERVAVVMPVFQADDSAPSGTRAVTPLEALERLDRQWIGPALAALNEGDFARVSIIANNKQLTLQRRDAFKRWRRVRGALAGLQ